MMAIAFPSDDQVAVINLDDPTLKWDAHDWRDKIRQAIAAWEASWDVSQAKYTIKFPFTVKQVITLEDEKVFDFYSDFIESFPEFAPYRCEELTAYQDIFGSECEGCVLLFIDESNGEVHYVYGGEYSSNHCQLLSEVGAYFVPAFEQKLAELGYTTDSKELDHYPWLVEYIPNYKPQE